MDRTTAQRSFLILVVLVAYVCFSSCQAKGLYVVDGDSFEMGQERVRLYGIDAPEFVQNCYDVQGNKYRCGLKAKDFLETIIAQGKISCKRFGKDRYGRSLKECFSSDGKSLNAEIVKNGWAVDYGKVYLQEEKEARRAKRGVWQGKFMRPELFRALQRKQEKNEKR